MSKTLSFTPSADVCARQMNIEITDNIVTKVQIIGGCAGNSQGISRLVTGMAPADAIAKLRGIRCGSRPTSCPDQLAIALESMIK